MASTTTSGITVRGAVQPGWATPVYQATPAGAREANAALAGEILARERDDTSLTLGAPHARKSAADLLAWDLPAVADLRAWIRAAVHAVTGADETAPMTAHAWAVVYRDRGFHEIHTHHDAAVSGVYYLRTTPGGGDLELYDPRPARLAALGANAASQPAEPLRTVVPHPGLLVAFPAWLPHAVTPHIGTEARMCIAFNAAFTAPTGWSTL